MSIRVVTVYETCGKQFRDFEKAVAHREDLVVEFLQKCPGFYQLLLKDRKAFIESLLLRRQELTKLLDYPDRENDVEEE